MVRALTSLSNYFYVGLRATTVYPLYKYQCLTVNFCDVQPPRMPSDDTIMQSIPVVWNDFSSLNYFHNDASCRIFAFMLSLSSLLQALLYSGIYVENTLMKKGFIIPPHFNSVIGDQYGKVRHLNSTSL